MVHIKHSAEHKDRLKELTYIDFNNSFTWDYLYIDLRLEEFLEQIHFRGDIEDPIQGKIGFYGIFESVYKEYLNSDDKKYAEGAMVAQQLHYDIEYNNVFVQGLTKAEDVGVKMTKKIKRVGCSTFKEILEENRLSIVDRVTITELMTFINKGMSYEADRGYNDDMVMNCVLFSWFITTEYFTHLTDYQVKNLLYSEQQKLIEDDILPVGVFGKHADDTSFVDSTGDRWFVDKS